MEDHRRVLAEMKAKAEINPVAFKKFMYQDIYDFKTRLHQMFSTSPEFANYRTFEQNREEARLGTNKLLVKVMQSFPMNSQELENDILKQFTIFEALSAFDGAVATKYAVNNFLYAKTVLVLGNEKHRHLVDRCLNNKDFGCFGLTELAHGSNVQGMITTATYDPDLDNFVLNTLNERGVKFWIGNAAQTANMAVIFANLVVGSKNYGIHAFVVPIRRQHDHSLTPGVIIGDCGQKLGLQGVDNGYLSFSNVRIPRENLLDRVTQVKKGGEVTSLFDKKSKRFAVQLAALSDGRVKIASACPVACLKGLIIGLRYTAQRRQFGPKGQLEQSLLDYPSIQQRLFPYFAESIISFFSNRKLLKMWNDNYKKLFQAEESREIKEMHALISIAKPLISDRLIACTNEVRMVCGGHGYSSYSGIPSLMQDYHVMVTWEGDNHVLMQQTAKFVMGKFFALMTKGKQPGYDSLDFLSLEVTADQVCPEFDSHKVLMDPSYLVPLLKYLAMRCVLNCMTLGQNLMHFESQWKQWNASVPFGLEQVARSYGILYIYKNGLETAQAIPEPKNKEYFLKLLVIYGLNNLKEFGQSLTGYFTQDHFTKIDLALLEIYESIKYDILAHCDELFIDDVELNSTLGAKEGGIYENIFSSLLTNSNNFGRPSWWREIWKIKNQESSI